MSALGEYTTNLVTQAREGVLDPIIGREPEMRRMMQVLGRRRKNNPVLIGQPGVGKTAIVEGLAIRIAKGRVPESLRRKQILSLDLGTLLAGTRFRGDFEERLKAVVGEVMQDPEYLLFIDELHTLVGTGDEPGALDAANMLKPALARNEFACIGATTIDEYQQHFARDKALSRRFQPVHVMEPNEEDTLVVLRGIKDRYESHHRVRIEDAALVAAVRIAQAHINERFLPDKAIDLIDEAASQLKLEIESVPEEIALAEERLTRLRIEERSIAAEGNGQPRLLGLQSEVQAQEKRVAWLNEEWHRQQKTVASIRDLLAQEEMLREEETRAREEGKLDVVAELSYSKLPSVSRRIEELERELASGDSLLRDSVGVQDVLAVASMWTGLSPDELISQ
jgi:ATP-dependent Clp protease ATP-binding subunit ClpB